ncbi:MAG: GNAT family N-acetyltransferase [Micropepsaceae bacterium]
MIKLRPATLADVAVLKAWDEEPHVVSATTDDPDAENAFEGIVWEEELEAQSDLTRYYIAELNERPIGAMQIIDPHLEPTHYWGDVAPNLRALDIWIGAEADLGHGYGEQMMRQAFAICFADPKVTAIIIDPLASNIRAHKFYQRLGFVPQGRRLFNGEDDCLVHELTREMWQSRTRKR